MSTLPTCSLYPQHYTFFVENVRLLAFAEALVFHVPGLMIHLEQLQEGQNLLENEDIKFKLVTVKL